MVRVTAAGTADVDELARVAACTFPLACPPTAASQNIAAFVDAHLSADRFTDYVDDPDRVVLIARDGSRIVGYAMLIRSPPDDDHVRRAVTALPTVELSKIYVLPERHGTGAAAALMAAALDHAARQKARSVWLGVNQNNQRAQRFYAKHGFTVTGTRTFHLGYGISAGLENDYVMVRSL